MATQKSDLIEYSGEDIFVTSANVLADPTKGFLPVLFATDTSATELQLATPLAYDSVNDKFGRWVAPDPAIVDIAGGTGAVLAVTVNGIQTADIAYNATAVAVKAAFTAIGKDVTATSDEAGNITVTFDADVDVTTVPALTVATTPTGATPTITAGTSTNGLHRFERVVWPNIVQLSATEEVYGTTCAFCEVPFSELVTAASLDAGEQTALVAYCKSEVLPDGIVVSEIPNQHK